MNLEKNDLKESRNLIRWEINKKCNFQCNYCGIWKDDKKQILTPIDIDKLAESLDYLKGEWQFDITGGEPFLEKNFIEICQAITKKHYMSLNTNLSTNNVFDFADNINPDKCGYIHASVHIIEREKNDVKLSSYIEKILYLQKKGFYPSAVYVTHPTLFDRIKKDIAFLESNGINKVRIQIFRGWFNEKIYPLSFNAEEKKFLESMEANYPEFEILNRTSFNFHGQLCRAGQRFFVMDRNGYVRRCTNVTRICGNFFEKSIKFNTKPKPCPEVIYSCPHECIEYSLDKKGNFISILKEDFIDKSISIKKEINNIRILKKIGLKI